MDWLMVRYWDWPMDSEMEIDSGMQKQIPKAKPMVILKDWRFLKLLRAADLAK